METTCFLWGRNVIIKWHLNQSHGAEQWNLQMTATDVRILYTYGPNKLPSKGNICLSKKNLISSTCFGQQPDDPHRVMVCRFLSDMNCIASGCLVSLLEVFTCFGYHKRKHSYGSLQVKKNMSRDCITLTCANVQGQSHVNTRQSTEHEVRDGSTAPP